MLKIQDYKDLIVWQKSMNLVEVIYRITARFPRDEQWGLVSQLRRAAISVPSNIAEGYGRQTSGEYKHSLCISRGSLFEIETQIILCHRLGFIDENELNQIKSDLLQIGKMLTVLVSKLKS
ncbi:MAG: four helix bundle protein [Bacteroidota bacterium]